MARILISFLGTGPALKSKDGKVAETHSARSYRKADYRLGDKDLGEFSFVSLALHKEFQFDKIFLIGTPASMWEEAYNQFMNYKDESYNLEDPKEEYYEIMEACGRNNYKSSLDSIPCKDKIEDAMPSGSKVVLIKYGLNEDEMKENANIILQLAESIEDKDELMVDITHSFRSLPLIIMQLVLYLRTIKPKINVSHIFYGMIDVAGELKYAPIVDLKSVLTLNDWITGAHSFLNFGSAYQIADLLGEEDKSDAQRLRDFSDAMNLNNFRAIKTKAQNLSAIQNKEYAEKLAGMVITPTVRNYVKTFSGVEKQSIFQLKLAEWQFNHHNYTAAYISAIESIVTYVCEINKNNIERETAKNILRDKEKGAYSCPSELHGKNGIYEQLRGNRNALAHLTNTGDNCSIMIRKLKENLTALKKIIK